MSDGLSSGTVRTSGGLADVLATRALTVVAGRTRRSARPADTALVEEMTAAALSPDWSPFGPVLARMQARGIAPEETADVYVPAVARLLGERWCGDSLSFAEVTIGCSRLQSLLRQLGPEWRADGQHPTSGPSVLVLVAEDIHHTLGAMVISGQLRRLGFSVRLTLGATPRDVSDLARRVRSDAVFLSAARGAALEPLRQIVDAARTGSQPVPPVVIGGALAGADKEANAAMAARTGADLVTNDVAEALTFCGLTTQAGRFNQTLRRA